jgi:pyruvate/2-oxoglutarate dehydrogenase complex dihydrolipoamide acyltransferase (E2) component
VNLSLHPAPPPGPLRRLALGAYKAPRDPSAYAAIEVRMERALAYMESFRAGTGQHLTVTHLVAKAAADALRRYPEANVLLRWNRPWGRARVGVCVLVVQPEHLGRVDLTTATLPDADALSLEGFAAAMEARVQSVRHRRDAVIERGKRRSFLVPGLLMNAALRLLSFVWYTLNVDLAWLGMPRDPFGSVAVSNVGSLGLERGWLAMMPYTRVALYLAPGAVREEPVLEGEALVPGRLMTLTCTFDARLLGPELVARVLHHIGAALEDPESAWGPPRAQRP